MHLDVSMIKFFFLCLLILSSSVIADDDLNNRGYPFKHYLLIGGGILLSTYAVSEQPEIYGAFLILGPLIVHPAKGKARDKQIIEHTAMASLGLYNILELSKDEYSSSDRITTNLIALSSIFAVSAIYENVTEINETKAYFSPIKNGALLAFSHKF